MLHFYFVSLNLRPWVKVLYIDKKKKKSHNYKPIHSSFHSVLKFLIPSLITVLINFKIYINNNMINRKNNSLINCILKLKCCTFVHIIQHNNFTLLSMLLLIFTK